MDIKGFGTVYIEELVHLGYIKDIADIFELKDHREELIEQGIIGKEKNTDKLLDTIEKIWYSKCWKGCRKDDHETFFLNPRFRGC